MALTVNKRIIQRQRAIKRRDYDTRAGKFRIQDYSSITDASKFLALKPLQENSLIRNIILNYNV